MKFQDTGHRLEKLATGITFPCTCGDGVVANGIVRKGILQEYQFQCHNCHHTYRMGPTGRLYKISAA